MSTSFEYAEALTGLIYLKDGRTTAYPSPDSCTTSPKAPGSPVRDDDEGGLPPIAQATVDYNPPAQEAHGFAPVSHAMVTPPDSDPPIENTPPTPPSRIDAHRQLTRQIQHYFEANPLPGCEARVEIALGVKTTDAVAALQAKVAQAAQAVESIYNSPTSKLAVTTGAPAGEKDSQDEEGYTPRLSLLTNRTRPAAEVGPMSPPTEMQMKSRGIVKKSATESTSKNHFTWVAMVPKKTKERKPKKMACRGD